MAVVAEDCDSPDPAAVIAAFELQEAPTAWAAVGGAWSNRVYRLDAGECRLAVKELRNPWAVSRWQDWLAESWSFEREAIAAGVAAPQPVPNPADGSCFAWVCRRDPVLPMARFACTTGCREMRLAPDPWSRRSRDGLAKCWPSYTVWESSRRTGPRSPS
jgi:hypothetical protein